MIQSMQNLFFTSIALRERHSHLGMLIGYDNLLYRKIFKVFKRLWMVNKIISRMYNMYIWSVLCINIYYSAMNNMLYI